MVLGEFETGIFHVKRPNIMREKLMNENRFWNFILQVFLLIMGDYDILWWFWIMLTMHMLVFHYLMFEGSCWLTVIVRLIKNCARMTCCMWMSRFWAACVSNGWVIHTCRSQTTWGWSHGCKNLIFCKKQDCELKFLFLNINVIDCLIFGKSCMHEIDLRIYD